MLPTLHPFEYVAILVSLILGLGITQVLSAIGDLLYHGKKLRLYWPHSIWVLFILFLHVQDWFITYALRNKLSWSLPELSFVLLYPVALYLAAKLLLPNQMHDNASDMKVHYYRRFPALFYTVSMAVAISVLFNLVLLHTPWQQQIHLFIFFVLLLFFAYKKPAHHWLHALLAVALGAGVILSFVLEGEKWVIT